MGIDFTCVPRTELSRKSRTYAYADPVSALLLMRRDLHSLGDNKDLEPFDMWPGRLDEPRGCKSC